MAAIAVTNRHIVPRGNWVAEYGTFTDSGGGNYEINTKVGRILHAKVQQLDGADSDVVWYMNSKTASTTEDDPGWIHLLTGASSGGSYVYRVIGKGR